MSLQTKKFIKGAFILSIAGILSKVVSIFFRVPLIHLIGDEGFGYYQMPYPIYTFLIAISYIGLPSAISKIISEKAVQQKYDEAHHIFQYTLYLLVILGALVSAILFFGSDFLIRVQGWVPATKYALWGLGFSALFVALMGAFRGYFQGLQDMMPTAVSQIVESIARVVVGIGLTYLLLQKTGSIAMAAGGAAFGTAGGGIAGTLTLIWLYYRKKSTIDKQISEGYVKTEKTRVLQIWKSVLMIAIPISIGAAVHSVMNWIDSTFVVRRLMEFGLNAEEASAFFGQLGKANTLVNVPLTLSMALMVSLVPAISEAIQRRDKEELKGKIETGLRFALLLGLPAATGLGILAQPILTLIYGRHNEGAEILMLLSLSLVFVIVGQGLTSILQGMGRFYTPIIHLLIGAFIKGWITYYTLPKWHVQGAVIGTIVGYATYACLNYYQVKKRSEYQMPWLQVVVKPIIAAIIMGLSVKGSYQIIERLLNSNTLATLLSVLLGAAVYFLVLILLGGLHAEDLEQFPQGNKILQKIKKENI
ncbi:MAG: polysaccharide biosynthesis protein [Epulopiscium sp.]|nr:polysaccharide biosynthesis protein [Candidatus Epulonipiscium sp.]